MDYDRPIGDGNSESQALEESPAMDTTYTDEPEARSKRIWIIAVVAVALIALVVAAMLMRGGDEAAISTEDQAPAVTIVSPGSGSVERVITASGTLFPRRELPVGVAGEGGQIARVLVEPGDWVRAGQVLAVIDQSVQSQQVQSAAANVRVAQADADLAQSNLDRALKLVERGFISQADIDRLQATRDAADARVSVARAQLGELKARNYRLNITAPAAGLVLERNVEPGQVVSSGSGVLFRLAKGGEMELRAQLAESDLAALSQGVTAKVTPTGTDKTLTGQVWQVSPVINQTSREGIARIALSYDPVLRPGGFATAEIINGAINAAVLPESAVQSDDDGTYVYVVGKDDKIVRKDIRIGQITANGIVVQSGLSGSERVVLYAAGFLNPGEKVRPKREASAES